MTPEQEILIIKWQFAATILMGLDYFIPDNVREKANSYVKSYFEGMQKRVDKDVAKAAYEFKLDLPRVLISLFQIALGSILFYCGKYLDDDLLYILVPLLLLAAFLIISGFNFAFKRVFEFIQILGIAAPFRGVTTFLVGSPKGPIAAIGFICLTISFYLRYAYISA